MPNILILIYIKHELWFHLTHVIKGYIEKQRANYCELHRARLHHTNNCQYQMKYRQTLVVQGQPRTFIEPPKPNFVINYVI